jgi:hypothetical protein
MINWEEYVHIVANLIFAWETIVYIPNSDSEPPSYEAGVANHYGATFGYVL